MELPSFKVTEGAPMTESLPAHVAPSTEAKLPPSLSRREAVEDVVGRMTLHALPRMPDRLKRLMLGGRSAHHRRQHPRRHTAADVGHTTPRGQRRPDPQRGRGEGAEAGECDCRTVPPGGSRCCIDRLVAAGSGRTDLRASLPAEAFEGGPRAAAGLLPRGRVRRRRLRNPRRPGGDDLPRGRRPRVVGRLPAGA